MTAVPGSTFWGTKVLKLSERHGFGWAVKTTLEQVATEYVPWSKILRQESDSCIMLHWIDVFFVNLGKNFFFEESGNLGNSGFRIFN